MDHLRKYPPQEVDFSKIPAIRDAFLKQVGKEINVEEDYHCQYKNKKSTYHSVDDFMRFLGIRQPETLIVQISAAQGKGMSIKISWLTLDFYGTGITQNIRHMEETIALELCDFIERELELRETLPIIEPPVHERSAFIAHSFDAVGEETAEVVRHLLELLHFDVVTGKKYSSKSLSEKVKGRMRDQGIIICILTKRWETTEGESLPASWVTQEAAFSEGLDKPLFLFIEEGVNKDLGIHGDIEYISFSAGNLTAPLLKLIEGLEELGYEFSD